MVINELQPQRRFALENMVLAGVWPNIFLNLLQHSAVDNVKWKVSSSSLNHAHFDSIHVRFNECYDALLDLWKLQEYLRNSLPITNGTG